MPHRILVVDDEPDLETLVLQRFRKRIRSEELSFLFAGNGEEALAKAAVEPGVDVVLTDINLPVMDGLTLLSNLRQAHPLVRSVVVSAYGDMQNIRTALNRGAFDFVTKPIDFADLEVTLDKAIGESILYKQAARDRDLLLGMHRELDLARGMQESLVPSKYPVHARFEVHGAMIPALHVGGDLFDFFLLEDGRLAFSIGDVSGKGIAAGLFMAVSRTLLRVSGGQMLPPNEVLTEMNRFLCHEKTTHLYLTCFYATLDLNTGVVEYSRAAHNSPYLVRAKLDASGKRVEELAAGGGLPLSLFDFATYETTTVKMEQGDCLVMFTDGVTEAMNHDHECYGEERLVPLLELQTASVPVQEIVKAVVDGAQTFASGAPPSDDITVLAIRYLGSN